MVTLPSPTHHLRTISRPSPRRCHTTVNITATIPTTAPSPLHPPHHHLLLVTLVTPPQPPATPSTPPAATPHHLVLLMP
ncbi:hypothetical protein Tco_1138859 [Tanacetum coccineum]